MDYDSDSFSDENVGESTQLARKSPPIARKKVKRTRKVQSCENCISESDSALAR